MSSKTSLVLVPATAAAVVLMFGLYRATGIAEVALLLAAAGLLLVTHLALRSRSLRLAAQEEARRVRSELELQARVSECERRRASLAAFSQLAAHVAHEVRNPLASIGLNLELLQEEMAACGASPPVSQLLAAIQGETDRLQKMTDDYLAFARPVHPVRAIEDLAAVARELAAFLNAEAAQAGVTLGVEAPAGPVPVSVDRNQIKQAALNLVRNGVQAMGTGGRLRVAVTGHDGCARFTVEDTGPGVPADARCRIFEPFYSTKQGGTGLGLPLALQIAREHGGDIELEDRQAAGARFTLSLPLATPAHPAADSTAPTGALAVEAAA